VTAVPRTRGVPPESFTGFGLSASSGAYTDGPALRARLIREHLLVPAGVVVKPPALPFWHGSPRTLRLLGNESATRESFLPSEEPNWRPRWRHAGSF
jgi:hypothetical protein